MPKFIRLFTVAGDGELSDILRGDTSRASSNAWAASLGLVTPALYVLAVLFKDVVIKFKVYLIKEID